MHSLARRQLRRFLAVDDTDGLEPPVAKFVNAVSETYRQMDDDRGLLERSLELTSAELLDRNVALERSNEELKQFAYVVSHDLKEPLRMVRSFTDLLVKRAGAQLDPTAQEYVQFVVDGAVRMEQLIDAILSVSRASTRHTAASEVDCAEIVRTVERILGVALTESAATVEVHPLPTVKADSVQMVQLFQNLIANALKFRGAEPPRVIVSAQDAGAHWCFVVRDNGRGLPLGDPEGLFQMFSRGRGEDRPGHGIGLAVCRRIVERHGGRIWAERNEDGVGASFLFTLPKSS